jgi:hypothetical protein
MYIHHSHHYFWLKNNYTCQILLVYFFYLLNALSVIWKKIIINILCNFSVFISFSAINILRRHICLYHYLSLCICVGHAILTHSRCSASWTIVENTRRAQWHRNVRRAFGVVRSKDNKTIKSQIRGPLVRMSEAVASARSREGVAVQKKPWGANTKSSSRYA